MAESGAIDDLEHRPDESSTNGGPVENVAGRDLWQGRGLGCGGFVHRLPVAGAVTRQIDESLGPFVLGRAQGDRWTSTASVLG
jgi:hypothetical protein